MSQNLPVNNFEWIKDTSQFNEDFIKIYGEEGDERYFLEADVQYIEKLNERHNDLPFLPERKEIEKVKKLVANLHSKTEYVIHIKNLKQVLDHGLVLKKVHKVIKFNQNAWLKPYIDLNTDLRKKAKNDFEKDFLKLMNHAVSLFGIRTKLSHYKIFLIMSISKRIEKTEIIMNNPVCLGPSVLESSKILMYKF